MGVIDDEYAPGANGECGRFPQRKDYDLEALRQQAKDFRVQSLYNPKYFQLEDDRDARLRQCRVVDTDTEEPRFTGITRLMAEVFKTPVCLITLIIDDRVWFKAKVGPFGSCVVRDGSWCNYIVVPTQPEILITEDASLDARFSHNPYVAGEPYIKFYAGAPLVGTGGRRYGTLCVVDLEARSYTAEMYHLLINFAELAVQEIERDSNLLETWKDQAMSDIQTNKKLRACLSTATDGVALLDVRSANWRFKYVNESFAMHAGEPVSDFVKVGFWEKFDPVGMTPLEAAKKIANGATANIKVTSKANGKRMWLCLRTAASDQLAPGKPVGVPSWVPSEKDPSARMGIDMEPITVAEKDPDMCQDVEKCFYFAVVLPDHEPSESDKISAYYPMSSGTHSKRSSMTDSSNPSASKSTSSEMSKSSVSSTSSVWKPLGSLSGYGDYAMPADLSGKLELGPLVGSGGFGKVFRGLYDEETVAVKVVEPKSDKEADAAVAEGALSKALDHPNIVKTLYHSKRHTDYQLFTDGTTVKPMEAEVIWILAEFCDRGTLIDGVERGWFNRVRSILSIPDMVSIYRTLRDIAEGMAYIHDRNIIHCDLNGRNVMLKWSPTDKRGFTAKVSDFGLATICHGESLNTKAFGTITHMSPELLSSGILSFKADVWAFGVLMWEMYTGFRAFQGRQYPSIIFAVTTGSEPLKLPETAPASYQNIMEQCLSYNPDERPTFHELVEIIDSALTQDFS